MVEETTPAHRSLDDLVGELNAKAIDDFSRRAIQGALHALADAENPLRLNFFSTAMRILFEHMMDTLAPVEQVKQSSWFKPERPDGSATRWQRVVFTIQGGLSDTFVKDDLKVDPQPLRKRLLDAVDDLSKQVHGREQTIVTARVEQDASARATVMAMTAFLDTIHDCRAAILDPIAEALDDAAVDALLSDSLLEVDELASHFSLEEVYVDRTVVHAIGAHQIIYRATGSVSVVLQWGSNSDLRRGDGAELSQSFPFFCDITAPLDEPWELDLSETSCGVDTSSWRDAMRPDEWDEP
ncbi:MAG: hypothetical protein ACK4FK_06895 [Ferrovibrio sp.]|uniref:pPIWI-associating nuclease domain-containing protein n=1 Tax=Ferrovibrio sp. TaxID=1917215 RepID=UPI00391C26EC